MHHSSGDWVFLEACRRPRNRTRFVQKTCVTTISQINGYLQQFFSARWKNFLTVETDTVPAAAEFPTKYHNSCKDGVSTPRCISAAGRNSAWLAERTFRCLARFGPVIWEI